MNGLQLLGKGWHRGNEYAFPIVLVLDRHEPVEFYDRELLAGLHGEAVARLLDMAGLSLDDVWVTCVVLCPADVIDVYDDRIPELCKKPQPKALAACKARLHRELHLAHPRLVVALGALAMQAVSTTPSLKFAHALGQIHSAEIAGDLIKYELPFLTTYSPSELIRNTIMTDHGIWRKAYEHINTAVSLVEEYQKLEFPAGT